MQSLMKINSKWQEVQALVKEGGTWKEIGAVTAKANGKWSDIAPPKPMVEPRVWTQADFVERTIIRESSDEKICYGIKPELRQYFIVGDTLQLLYRQDGTYLSTPIPGVSDGDKFVTGGKITGIPAKNDAMTVRTSSYHVSVYTTYDRGWIPITDGTPVVYEPRTWTIEDFDVYGTKYYIKPENRQFFMVGDSFDFIYPSSSVDTLELASTEIPGLVFGSNGTKGTITGTITGGVGLTDVVSFRIYDSGSPIVLKRISALRMCKLSREDQTERSIQIKPA